VVGRWVGCGWVGCELGAAVGFGDGVSEGVVAGVAAGTVGFDDGSGTLAAIGPGDGFTLDFGVVAAAGSSASLS
jgi:hypothetical protein